jgi:hypothetical protein
LRSLLLLVFLVASAAVNAGEWQPPRMPWGDPDLQGTWTNATLTGLERFAGMDTLVISDGQARALEKRDAEFSVEIDSLPDGDLPSGDRVGGYNSAWLDRGNSLLRIDGEPRTSIIVDPDDGRVPYTFSGWVRLWWGLINSQKRDNPEEQLLGDRCVVGYGSTAGPPMLPVLYNNNYRFVQTPDSVAILVEMNHSVRTVRIGGSPLPAAIRPWFGDSIGHWEGDTLVVRTTHFHPEQSLRGAIKHQLYVGRDSVVTERFTRTGPAEIRYEFAVEDDDIYTQPWRGELNFRPSHGQIYEYACHEGNYGMVNMLAGERAHGTNGLIWLLGLALHMPEEVTHPQLSGSRFDE